MRAPTPDRSRPARWIAAALLLLFALPACREMPETFRRDAPASALAVVGDEWITRADVLAELETLELDTIRERDIARYVNRWIDRKLLLREARRMGLDDDEDVRRRLAELEAEVLIGELLSRSTVIEEPTSARVVEYWKNHTGEYKRVTDEVTLVIGWVDSKNRAWRLREGFDQSVPAFQMLEEIGVSRFDTLRTIEVGRLPDPISDAIRPLRSGHASLPVEYQGEWMIVKLLERFDARTTRPVEEVEDLVRARLMAEDRTRRERDFIDALQQEALQRGEVRIRLPRVVTPSESETRPDTLSGSEE